MADKFGLARPGGNVSRVVETDIFVVGGIKTISVATHLNLITEGAGSNLEIAIDSSGTGGILGTVGSGGIKLATLGVIELDAVDASYLWMQANDPSDKQLRIQAQNNGAGKGILYLWGNDHAQLGTGGAQDNVTLDFVEGISISSPSAIYLGKGSVGGTHGPIFIGVIGDDQDISIGNLNLATPVIIHAGTDGLGLKSTQDITFDGRACLSPLTYNQDGELDLNASYQATSIIGAFNEIKASITTTITIEVDPSTVAVVDSIPVTGNGGAEWFYTLYSDDNIRSGKIGCAWENGTPSVKYWEFGTTDIGDTSDVTFQVVHTGTHIELQLVNSGASFWMFNATRSIAGAGSVGDTPSGWNDLVFVVTGSGTLESFEPLTDGMAVYYLVVTDQAGNVSERTVTAAWSVVSGLTTYSVSTTPDIGDTTPVSLSVDYVGGLLSLNVTVLSGTWTITGTKYMRSV